MSTEMHSDAWPIPVAITLALVAFLYLRGWHHRRQNLPKIAATWRLVAFLAGVLAVGSVWATPVSHRDHQSLVAHMLQHLVLMTVAAPLVLLGEPVITLRHLPRRRGSCEIIPSTPKDRLPVAPLIPCWLAGTLCVLWWHLPSLFEWAMRSEYWHSVEQATFLAAGLLFWWPVVEQWSVPQGQPQWSIPLYLFLAALPCDALSAFLTFCGRVVYPIYGSGAESSVNAALRDQEVAGSLMWVWVTFVYVIPAIIISVQKLSAPQPQIRRIIVCENVAVAYSDTKGSSSAN